MSEQEKAKVIEERLPTVEAVIDEYRTQGKELSRQEAEKTREQLRAALAAGHVDARDDGLSDDVLDNVAGGAGGVPNPGGAPNPTLKCGIPVPSDDSLIETRVRPT